MLTPYRRVLALPGALAFSASGLVARLPISMVTLGIVLLVSARSGSYSLAGSVAAAYMIANAAFAVLQGRLVDRLGQSRVLPWTILVFTVSLSLLTWSVEAGWPTPLPHVFAVVAGSSLPQIGSCVRARWSRLVSDRDQLNTAFSFEAVVDETVFMVGPTLVTVLATVWHPVAGLATAGLAGLVGTLLLAAQRSTEPPPHRPAHRQHPRVPMGWWVLGPLVVSAFTMGVLFGGAEVATVAFAEEAGSRTAAGPLLASWALGSLLAGFVVGVVRWRASNATRFRWSMLALAMSLVPLPFVESITVMAVVLFLAGFTISPTLIASVAWVEETVPGPRLTEGIAILTTGMYAGLAPGAAIVGVAVDRYGASASYWVAVAAVTLGSAAAFGTLLLPTEPVRVTVEEPSPSESSA
jgi:MFS family permease